MIRLLAIGLVLVSQVVWAYEWEEIHLGVDENRFYFNVVISGFPNTLTVAEFKLRTKPSVIGLPVNQEEFFVDIEIPVNNILGGPRVEPIEVPEMDRWLDGEVADFKSRRIVDGTWQFIGSIVNGENPYLPGDQLGEIRLYHPGGSMAWTNHPILAQPPPSLSVSKSSSTRLVTSAGQVVTYVYEIRNTGQVVLNDVGLSDDNVDAEPFCDFSDYDSLEVAPNPESLVICSATHTVTDEEIELGEPLVNIATAFADGAEAVTATHSIPMGLFADGFENPENLITVLDHSNVTGLTSIATGFDGFAVVSYTDRDLDGVTGTLKVAKCNNSRCSNFTSSAVNEPGHVISTSIAVGDDGFPVISYLEYDTDTNTAMLKVAKCNDPACDGADEVIAIVDDQEGRNFRDPSIAMGLDGYPVISYYDSTAWQLNVAKCNDPACQGGDETLSIINDPAASAGFASSIAVAPEGFPIISYLEQVNPWESIVKVAKCNDTACSGENEIISGFGSTGGFINASTGIVIGADGLPVFAYRDRDSAALMVAKCNDAACSGNDETEAAVGVSYPTGTFSLAIGADDFPVVSYPDNQALRIVKCNDASCSEGGVISTVVDDLHNVGNGSDIAIGADGLPIISYRNSSAGTLKIIHCGTESCQ